MKPNVPSTFGNLGVVGAVLSTMACPLCFPALASIGAAAGLGFLSHWERLFVKVVPLFAVIVLAVNGLGRFRHRQWRRSALGMIGPSLVLIGWASFMSRILPRGTASGVLYAGLAAMVVFAVWDLVSPSSRHCTPEGCELPTKQR